MKRSDVQRTAFWYDAHDETDGFVHITVTRRRGSAHGGRFCVCDRLFDRFQRGAESTRSGAHPTPADAPTDTADSTPYADTDAHSYSDPHPHTYTDSDADTHAYSYSYSDSHPANANADTTNYAAKFPGKFVAAAGCLGRDLCCDRNGFVNHQRRHRSGG